MIEQLLLILKLKSFFLEKAYLENTLSTSTNINRI